MKYVTSKSESHFVSLLYYYSALTWVIGFCFNITVRRFNGDEDDAADLHIGLDVDGVRDKPKNKYMDGLNVYRL